MNIKKNYFWGLFVFMGGSILFIVLMNYILPKTPSPTEGIPHNYWIPTEEDIQYQDSMFQIIQQTQFEVDTIKQDIDKILYKLERLEYADGTWDSIRIRR